MNEFATLKPHPVDAETVIYRLEEAGKTLIAIRGKNLAPAGMGCAWPDVVRSIWDSYDASLIGDKPIHHANRSPIPAPAAIDRMDEAWRWVGLIPLDKALGNEPGPWSRHGGAVRRRIVLLRSLVSPTTERHLWSWRRIGERERCSHEAIRGWHAKGIDTIVRRIAQGKSP